MLRGHLSVDGESRDQRADFLPMEGIQFSVSDPVSPHAPALYSSTGRTNASLIYCIRNRRDHMERKAVSQFLNVSDQASKFRNVRRAASRYIMKYVTEYRRQ